MITIILPISRKNYLLPMFKCLDELIKPADTELLLITDGDEELDQMVQSILDVLVGKFRRIQVREFGDSPAAAINDRRYRISNIHNFAKKFISEDVDKVFLIEDDTNFPPTALMTLLEDMDKTGAAYVQGVEVGRWKTPYIGGWLTDNFVDPSLIFSVPPSPTKDLQSIDAGGLYCCLVDAQLYFEHIFEPFDKQGKNGLSCDVNFGLWLKRKGHKVMMDWSVDCGHYKEGRQLRLAEITPVKVTFEKINDKWTSKGDYFDVS